MWATIGHHTPPAKIVRKPGNDSGHAFSYYDHSSLFSPLAFCIVLSPSLSTVLLISCPLPFLALDIVMSLASEGHVYLTGKTKLENARGDANDEGKIIYDGTVDCHPTHLHHGRIRGIFSCNEQTSGHPLSDGLYNISSKV